MAGSGSVQILNEEEYVRMVGESGLVLKVVCTAADEKVLQAYAEAGDFLLRGKVVSTLLRVVDSRRRDKKTSGLRR